jgi:hypothetical protein
MRQLDPFLSKRSPDPDQVIKSRPAKAVMPPMSAASPPTPIDVKNPPAAGRYSSNLPNMRRGKTAKCGACPYATAEEKRVAKGSGDFTDCMDRIVPKVNPDDPEAFCAWYEHEQSGHWPGEKRKSRGAPETARPPGPRVIEVDGDQDSIARVAESDDPVSSHRPGYTTDAAEEGESLMRDVAARNRQRMSGGKYAFKDAWLRADAPVVIEKT